MEKEIKSQSLRPPKGEGQLRTFWRKTSKGENSEKIRKEPTTNVADTTLVLVSRAANEGNQWYTKNPKNVL